MFNWKTLPERQNIVSLVSLVFLGFLCFIALIYFNYDTYLHELELVIIEEEQESQKMRLNSELMEVARARTRLTSQLIDTDDPFEQDEINLELDIYASRFAVLRNQLLQLDLTEQEKNILDEHNEIVAKILPAQRQAVDFAMSDEELDDKKAHDLLYKIVLPGQQKLVDSFGALITLEQERIAQLTDSTRISISKMNKRMRYVIVIAVVIIVFLSILVINRIRKIQNQLFEHQKNLESRVERRTSELRSAQSMLQSVINTIPDRVFWKDRNGYYLGANSLFAQDAGLSTSDELIGKTDFEMPWANHAESIQKSDHNLITLGESKLNYSERSIKDGKVIWLEHNKVPIKNEQNEFVGLLGTYHDITARKIADEKLTEAIEETKAANLYKSQFLATMSHEIRTPMNGVLGMAELLNNTDLSLKQKEYVQAILNSGELLLTIINDILDFSKLEAGKVELENIDFDLEWLTDDVLQMMLPKSREKGIELILDYQLDAPHHFCGDPSRLRQILFNLVGNAVKFTEQGHVLLSVRYEAIDDKSANITIKVQDTGVGISKDQQIKLFQSFTQADSSTTRKYGGTGLGLSICKQLIEVMNGKISVESVPQEGAVFAIELPLVLSEQPEKLSKESIIDKRALFLDDNSINCQIFNDMLTYFGTDVDIVSQGDEVLPILYKALQKQKPYDIVLLDNHLPVGSGLEIGEKVSLIEEFSNIPLVILSSSVQHGDVRQFESAGFSGYLTKPVRQETLRAVMESVLALKHKPNEIITRHKINEIEQGQEAWQHFSGHILLAEDTLVNQQVVSAMLKKMGLTLDVANNGVEAINLWKKNHYDLIFMDGRMPEMDGYEATTYIRTAEKQTGNIIPIIALTANTSDEDRQQCFNVGMNEIITKPFRANDLMHVLSHWLNTSNIKDKATLTSSNNEINLDREDDINIAVFENMKDLLADGFTKLIAAFYKSTDDIFRQLNECTVDDNVEMLQRLPHSLKSSSANVGAMKLSKAAEECELLIKQGQIEQALNKRNQLKSYYEKTKQKLEELGYPYSSNTVI